MTAPRAAHDEGSISLGLVVMAVAVLVAIGLVVDGGAKLRAVEQATRVAAEAARAGAQEVDVTAVQTAGTTSLDPARARTAARTVLDAAGVEGEVQATQTRVTVHATASRSTVFLGMIGVNSVTGHGSAQAGLTVR